jgi:hypothetical protein
MGIVMADPATGIFNPRLSDVFGLVIKQDEVDFVVPHLREDLPLYLDPFLLWKSEDPEYRQLHADLLATWMKSAGTRSRGWTSEHACFFPRSVSRQSLDWLCRRD